MQNGLRTKSIANPISNTNGFRRESFGPPSSPEAFPSIARWPSTPVFLALQISLARVPEYARHDSGQNHREGNGHRTMLLGQKDDQ